MCGINQHYPSYDRRPKNQLSNGYSSIFRSSRSLKICLYEPICKRDLFVKDVLWVRSVLKWRKRFLRLSLKASIGVLGSRLLRGFKEKLF